MYRIGVWIGEGAERIVHELENVRSGETLHLIKILRDQNRAREIAEHASDALRKLREYGLPTTEDAQIVEAHGGVFEVEESAAPTRGEVGELAARARTALVEKRRDDASELCQRILAVSPENTTALHVTACLRELAGQYMEALQLQQQVLAIEPNLRPHRFWMMERLASQGLLRSFLGELGDLKARWPHERRMDPLAARVLLALGRPSEGAALGLHANDNGEAELVEQIQREAKAYEEARRELAKAREATLSKDESEALAALWRAYQRYQKDPIIALNLGAALLRNGDWGSVDRVLAPVSAIAPEVVNRNESVPCQASQRSR